jgi:hypothetical protein
MVRSRSPTFTSFIYGMQGDVGNELRCRNPASVEDALNMAAVVCNATELESCRREAELLTVRADDKGVIIEKEQEASKRSDRRCQQSQANRFHRTGNGIRDGVCSWVVCFTFRCPGHFTRYCHKVDSGIGRGPNGPETRFSKDCPRPKPE